MIRGDLARVIDGKARYRDRNPWLDNSVGTLGPAVGNQGLCDSLGE
jgi:hypothetical protein